MVLISLFAGQAGADERAGEAKRTGTVAVVPAAAPAQGAEQEEADPGRALRITGAVLMLSSAASLTGAIYYLKRAQDLNDEYWRLGGIYAPDYASMASAHDVNEEGKRTTLLTWACGALTAALLGSGAIVYGLGLRYPDRRVPALAVHPRGVSVSVAF